METTNDQLFEQFQHIVGIYSGQVFAERIDFSQVSGMTIDDWNILLKGPDHEDYIEVWASLQEIVITDDKGKRWLVHENEGIFLYPEEIADLINWDELNG